MHFSSGFTEVLRHARIHTFMIYRELILDLVKSSLYSRYCAEHVVSGEAHLRGLAPGQYSYKEMLQRWQAIGNTAFDLTSLQIEPGISCVVTDAFNHYVNWLVIVNEVVMNVPVADTVQRCCKDVCLSFSL